jgi:MerR family redox-sensitive transcriptional activator SoxR
VAKDLAISDVARVFGLRTSAIRYYEQIGILPPPMRKNGQRRYNDSVLFRLAVVQRARETGFTLEEIRELFFGLPPGTPPPKRWHQLCQRKIAELRNRIKRLKPNGDVAQRRGELSLRRTRRARRKNSSAEINVKRSRFPKEALFRNKFSVFAMTPCRALSPV